MQDTWRRIKESRNLKQLAEALPRQWVERALLAVLVMYIWIPIFWIGAVFQPVFTDHFLLMQMNYCRFVLRQITLTAAAGYLVYCAGLAWGHIRAALRVFFWEKPWNIMLLFFLLWIFVSCLRAPDPALAFAGSEYRQEGFFTYLEYAAVYLVACALHGERKKRFLMRNFALAALVNGVVLLLQYIRLAPPIYGYCGLFLHFNHYGYYVTLALMCLAGLFCMEEGYIRLFVAAESVFLIWTLIINDTTGAFVAVCAGLACGIFLAAVSRTVPVRRMLAAALGFAAVCVLVTFLPERLGGSANLIRNIHGLGHDIAILDEESAPEAGSGRIRIWQRVLDASREEPVFGHGPDQMVIYRFDGDEAQYTRAANEYLYHLLAFGIPGCAAYLIALILGLMTQMRRIRRLPQTAVCAGAVVLAYLVSAFFGNSVFTIYPLFIILLAFSLSSEKKNENFCLK